MQIIEDRRELHRIPELDKELPNTMAYLRSALEGLKCKVFSPMPGALCAFFDFGAKEAIAFRAEADALPITERTGVSFSSRHLGRMHACGHDGHMAILLELARRLSRMKNLPHNVLLVFQPAEETMEGGLEMVEGGVLENPHVDAAMAGHVLTATPMPVGSLILMGSKTKMAAVDWFTVHITGKGCHGAMPNTGVDPLNVMSHIYIALQTINSREIDPLDNLVLTIGKMQGGEVNNVIPNEAEMRGTIRTLSNETRAMVKRRMEEIVSSIGTAFGAEAYVEWCNGCPVLMQDPAVYKEIAGYLKGLEGLPIIDIDEVGAGGSGGMGSEDFAHVANRVPSVFVGIPAGQPKDGYVNPQHHPMAVFQEDGLPGAAAAFVYASMQWLKDHK